MFDIIEKKFKRVRECTGTGIARKMDAGLAAATAGIKNFVGSLRR